MLKAGALVYAIIIGLIIALTSSSLILVSYFSSIRFESYADRSRIMSNARSGINLLLAETTMEGEREQRVDLYGQGNDSVILKVHNWGAWEVLVSTGMSGHNRCTMTAFAGNNFSDDTTMALYLADMDKPLSLCGKTLLKGTCYLPKAGTKRAYIEGQNFIGDRMVDGSVKESSQNIPEVNKALMARIKTLFLKFSGHDRIVNLEETALPDTMNRSFSDSTICFYSNAVIRVTDNRLEGNIQILSARKVIISSNAVLENVIIAAPQIEVESDFTGAAQLFASDSIIIGEKCKFNYPSVIGLLPGLKSGNNPVIIVKEKSEIKGVLFAWSEHPVHTKQNRIVIGKECVVNGYVYSDALLDLQGSVFGSVICQKFILSTPSSVYENHLLGAVIDKSRLSKYFVGINLVARDSHKKLVKWIYSGQN